MMINHIITSSIVIIFVLLIGKIFETRISACLKYSLWLLAVMKLLLPLPGFESEFHVLNFIEFFTETENDRQDWIIGQNSELSVTETNMTKNSNGIETDKSTAEIFTEDIPTEENNIYLETNVNTEEVQQGKENKIKQGQMFMKAVYLAGVIVCLGAFLISNIRFYINFKNKRKYLKTYKGKIQVYKIEDYYGACLYGGFLPVIIVGDNKNLTIEQQHMIMLHEYVHYTHGDHIWSMVRCLCVAFYWFHPLVWLAASVSRKDGELACDEGTIRRIGKKQRIAYGQTLLEIAAKLSKKNDIMSAVFLNSTTATGGKEEMKKRISMIAKGRKKSSTALILTIVLSAVCIGCTLGKPVEETVSTKQNELEITNTDESKESVNDENATEKEEEEKQSDTDEITQKYPNVYDKPQKDKVCILIQPSEIREQLNYYYIPTDEIQEELKVLLDNTEVLSEVDPKKPNLKFGFSCGWSLEYDDKQYQAFENGYMIRHNLESESLGTIFYDQNPELIELVNNLLVQELNYGRIDIETIKELASATLSVKDFRTDYRLCEQTITDEDKLKNLEAWFRNAKRVSGSYDCGNNGASLLLKTSSGKEIKMSLASDDCTIYAVNGIYYDYRPADKITEGWYSNHVFDLFDQIPNAFEEGNTVELEAVPGTDSSAFAQEIENTNSQDKVTEGEWATETVLEVEAKTFVWPTESTTISTTFGERVHPVTGEKKVIDYIGIAGNEGDSVYAVADGEITNVGFDNALGSYIVLAAITGEEVTYGHLGGSKVPKGAQVKAGEIIGVMGKTGNATGTFLSLTVKVNGEAVDPILYFEMDFGEETITYSGREYKKSELCNATLKWLELSEKDRMLSSYFPPEFMIFEETWGVTLTVEDITSTSVTIKCTQSGGNPTGELQTGSWYILETWTKEKGWIQMPYIIEGEIGWTAEAWIIPMNDTCEWEVDWEWLYGIVPSGKYRIGKSVMNFRKSGDFDTAIYYTEFEIKK